MDQLPQLPDKVVNTQPISLDSPVDQGHGPYWEHHRDRPRKFCSRDRYDYWYWTLKLPVTSEVFLVRTTQDAEEVVDRTCKLRISDCIDLIPPKEPKYTFPEGYDIKYSKDWSKKSAVC